MEHYMQYLTPSTFVILGAILIYMMGTIGKRYLSKSNFDTLQSIVMMSVQAAEQLAQAGQMAPQERREYALTTIYAELAKQKINFNPEIVMAALESMVFNLKGREQK